MSTSLNPRELWHDAKANAPEEAVLLLNVGGTHYCYGADAQVLKYALGESRRQDGETLNTALNRLSGLGVAIVESSSDRTAYRSDDCSNDSTERSASPKSCERHDLQLSFGKRTEQPQKYAAQRAPKGGITVQGQFYPGGQWIPAEVIEQATTKEIVELERGAAVGRGMEAPGEAVTGQPPAPTMENPVPLPYPDGGLGAPPAPGAPGFVDMPEPEAPPIQPEDIITAEAVDEVPPDGDVVSAEAGAPPPVQQEAIDETASFFGRGENAKQTAGRFNVAVAKQMGLEMPEGRPEDQERLATEFLRENQERLQTTMDAAQSLGWKPSKSTKRTLTKAVQAGRFIMGEAVEAGYEPRGGDMEAELKGAAEHLGKAQRAPDADIAGLIAAVTAFGVLSRIAGPMLAIPAAVAFGFYTRGNTSTDVPEAKRYLDQVAARFGMTSPFAPTTEVHPVEKKPRKQAPSKREPKDEPTTEPPKAPVPQPKVIEATPEERAQAAEARRAREEEQARRKAEGAREARAAATQETQQRYSDAVQSQHPNDQGRFKREAEAMWQDRVKSAQNTLSARRELIGQIVGAGGSVSQFTRDLQRAEDPDQVARFDELRQAVENDPGTYAPLLGLYGVGGEWDADSQENALFEALRRPESSFAAPTRADVAEELADLWAAQDARNEEEAPPEPEEDFDFGANVFRRSGWALRYAKWFLAKRGKMSTKMRRARKGGEISPVTGLKYKGGFWMPVGTDDEGQKPEKSAIMPVNPDKAQKLSKWEESKHPRDEEGQFASGEEIVRKARSEQAKATFDPEQKRASGLVREHEGGPLGEYGPNDEFYQAGAWIASTDMPKKAKAKIKKAATGKREIEPFKWEVPPVGKAPIFRLGGAELDLREGKEGVFRPYAEQRHPPEVIKQLEKIAEQWKAGERYFDVLESPSLVYFDDIARMMQAEQPIPGVLIEKAKEFFGADFERYKPNPSDEPPAIPATPTKHQYFPPYYVEPDQGDPSVPECEHNAGIEYLLRHSTPEDDHRHYAQKFAQDLRSGRIGARRRKIVKTMDDVLADVDESLRKARAI